MAYTGFYTKQFLIEELECGGFEVISTMQASPKASISIVAKKLN
jgi:hypothetical protein